MPWIRINNGKRAAYLTNDMYKELKYSYLEDVLHMSTEDLIGFHIAGQYKKEKRKMSQHISKYLSQRLRQDSAYYDKLNNIEIYGEEAQKEVYEFLWSFCMLFPSIHMGRHYHGRLDIPDSVNAYLPSTFGNSFCLCQTKRIIENMSVTHCVIGSYDIHVDNLLSIRCGLYGFSLMFRDGYVIRCHLCDYKSPLYVRLEGTIDPAFERFAIKAMREYECKKTNSYYSENAFRDGYSKKRIPFDIFMCLLENYYTLWDDVILHYEVNDDQAITLTLLNPYGRQNLIRITPEGTFVTEDKTMINSFGLYLLNNMLEIVDLPQHNSKP